jgi:CheY-like chemotaxis protein
MPVMDGYTAAKKMRGSNLPWARTTPIISVSAESGGDLYEKCREAGITDCVPKPVDVEILFKKIGKYLSA